jgi:hypothetical protein
MMTRPALPGVPSLPHARMNLPVGFQRWISVFAASTAPSRHLVSPVSRYAVTQDG